MDLILAPVKEEIDRYSVFLAGSIEQGKAVDWQKDIAASLEDLDGVLLSPRRDNWDADWPNDPDFSEFRQQVEWELEHIKLSDTVFFYFQPDTLSPISLLELGLVLGEGRKPVIVCPEGFWRRGNVLITAEQYGVEVLGSLEEGVDILRKTIENR